MWKRVDERCVIIYYTNFGTKNGVKVERGALILSIVLWLSVLAPCGCVVKFGTIK